MRNLPHPGTSPRPPIEAASYIEVSIKFRAFKLQAGSPRADSDWPHIAGPTRCLAHRTFTKRIISAYICRFGLPPRIRIVCRICMSPMRPISSRHSEPWRVSVVRKEVGVPNNTRIIRVVRGVFFIAGRRLSPTTKSCIQKNGTTLSSSHWKTWRKRPARSSC